MNRASAERWNLRQPLSLSSFLFPTCRTKMTCLGDTPTDVCLLYLPLPLEYPRICCKLAYLNSLSVCLEHLISHSCHRFQQCFIFLFSLRNGQDRACAVLRPTAPRKTSMISASTEIESVAVLDSSVRWRRQGTKMLSRCGHVCSMQERH